MIPSWELLSCTDLYNDTIWRSETNELGYSEAVYSACGKYRYVLKRTWSKGCRYLVFLMLNPSTATESFNDPTVARCQKRARVLGYDGFIVVNIFAYRATDPVDMKKCEQPIEHAAGTNDHYIMAAIREGSGQVVVSWGVHGSHMNRWAWVSGMLEAYAVRMLCLGVTLAGHPRHPLMIADGQELEPWRHGWSGTYPQILECARAENA